MTAGALVYCLRSGLPEVARAALVTGFIGGIGFAAASMLKLVQVQSGYTTNWHSILEQTTGFFNGLGLAIAMRGLDRRVDRVNGVDSEASARELTSTLWAVGFVLVAIPYLNLRKNVADWTRAGAVPLEMYGIPAWVWFDLAAAAATVTLALLLMRHSRRPLPVVPENPLGRGQGLYVLLLAIMVIGNFERALVGFKDQRLVTEGVILLNALLCTLLILTADPVPRTVLSRGDQAQRVPARWGRLVAIGLMAALVSVIIDWAIVRRIYGDKFAGHAGLSIRFGPSATTSGPRR
jgi:hypothetical protein